MNVSCPECRSVFRVDPAKVPPARAGAVLGLRRVITISSGASMDDEFVRLVAPPPPLSRTVVAGETSCRCAWSTPGFAAAVMDALRGSSSGDAAMLSPPPSRRADGVGSGGDQSRRRARYAPPLRTHSCRRLSRRHHVPPRRLRTPAPARLHFGSRRPERRPV